MAADGTGYRGQGFAVTSPACRAKIGGTNRLAPAGEGSDAWLMDTVC